MTVPTSSIFFNPLFVALRGRSTGKVRRPSERVNPKMTPDARGKRAAKGAVSTEGSAAATATLTSRVSPKTVPIWLMVKLALMQA